MRRVSYGSTCTCGFTSRMRSRADSSFGRPTSFVPCKHLALQIRHVDDVEVDESECADASGREIQRERRAEPARADEQDATALSFRLTVDADVGKDEMPAVSQHLFVGQRVATIEVWHLTHPPAIAGTTVSSSPSCTAACEAAVEADVFVVQIERDERIRIARVVAQPRRERGVPRGDVGDDGADGVAFGVEYAAVGELGENGWQMQCDGHDR